MTRTELLSLKGKELIKVADEKGVKVACNKERTQLKESKKLVVDRLVDYFENEEAKEVETKKTTRRKVTKKDTKKSAELRAKENDFLIEGMCAKYNFKLYKSNRANQYFIRANKKAVKVRATKTYFVCYATGDYTEELGGEYSENSNRTKLVAYNLKELANIIKFLK